MTDEKESDSYEEIVLVFDDSEPEELHQKLMSKEISYKELYKQITGKYPPEEYLKEFAKNHPKLIAE